MSRGINELLRCNNPVQVLVGVKFFTHYFVNKREETSEPKNNLKEISAVNPAQPLAGPLAVHNIMIIIIEIVRHHAHSIHFTKLDL